MSNLTFITTYLKIYFVIKRHKLCFNKLKVDFLYRLPCLTFKKINIKF